MEADVFQNYSLLSTQRAQGWMDSVLWKRLNKPNEHIQIKATETTYEL